MIFLVAAKTSLVSGSSVLKQSSASRHSQYQSDFGRASRPPRTIQHPIGKSSVALLFEFVADFGGSAKAGEPPLPFPPPPPFIPLESSKVDSQIGLLKNFYQERFAAVAATSAHAPPPNPAPAAPAKLPPVNPHSFPSRYSSSSTPFPSTSSLPPSASQPAGVLSVSVVLPDDPPNPTRCKVGPLGQVIMSNPSTGGKKKSKAKDANADKGPDKEGKEVAASGQKKNAPKKKKGKDEQQANGTAGREGNSANSEVNGTSPKKKVKSAGSGKKVINGAKLDVPSAIIASA